MHLVFTQYYVSFGLKFHSLSCSLEVKSESSFSKSGQGLPAVFKASLLTLTQSRTGSATAVVFTSVLELLQLSVLVLFSLLSVSAFVLTLCRVLTSLQTCDVVFIGVPAEGLGGARDPPNRK